MLELIVVGETADFELHQVNRGIALVTPIEAVHDILYRADLVMARQQADDELSRHPDVMGSNSPE
jgi:hypothetical protein